MTRPDARELCRRVPLVALIGREVVLRQQGRDYVGLCPFHQESTPSFSVNPEKGFYYCFGCRATGDAVTWLRNYYRLDFKQALERLAAEGGGAGEMKQALPRKPAPEPGDAERKAAAIRWAWARWDEALPADCTPVEHYLAGRGIDVAGLGGVPAALRYHRRLRHAETGKDFYGMVARIDNAAGEFCGLHRTFLSTIEAGANPTAAAAMRARGYSLKSGEVVVKAAIARSKKMIGVAKGGAVRMAAAGRVLGIAEGIETALSVMQATEMPVWAALSLGNLPELTLPPEVEEVTLFADGDSKDQAAGEAILLRAVSTYEAQGVKTRIARPPAGLDFNDVLLKQFKAEVSHGSV